MYMSVLILTGIFRIIVFPVLLRRCHQTSFEFPLHYILAKLHVLPKKETHAVTKNIAYDYENNTILYCPQIVTFLNKILCFQTGRLSVSDCTQVSRKSHSWCWYCNRPGAAV